MKLFETKMEHELDTDVAMKLVETFLSSTLTKKFKQTGFSSVTEPPYRLNNELEIRNFHNVLSTLDLAAFKVYLLTELNWYKEQQKQGTAQQPKNQTVAFIGDCRNFKDSLGWGFNHTWIQAEHWTSAVTNVIDKLKQKCPSFAKERINAVFLTDVSVRITLKVMLSFSTFANQR
jgi:hypothetical protein